MEKLAFHPHDPTQISVIGSRGWLLLHLEEGTNHLKMTEELLLHQDDGNYWCHAWVSDTRILVGCDHGKLHLIEGCQVQHHFNIIKVNTDNMR